MPRPRYQDVKRWRAGHREEDRRRDRVYKQLRRNPAARARWEAVRSAYGPACLRCGEVRPLVPDHVLPVSQGGDNRPSNLQPLCQPCNMAKRGQRLDHRPDQGAQVAHLDP